MKSACAVALPTRTKAPKGADPRAPITHPKLEASRELACAATAEAGVLDPDFSRAGRFGGGTNPTGTQ